VLNNSEFERHENVRNFLVIVSNGFFWSNYIAPRVMKYAQKPVISKKNHTRNGSPSRFHIGLCSLSCYYHNQNCLYHHHIYPIFYPHHYQRRWILHYSIRLNLDHLRSIHLCSYSVKSINDDVKQLACKTMCWRRRCDLFLLIFFFSLCSTCIL